MVTPICGPLAKRFHHPVTFWGVTSPTTRDCSDFEPHRVTSMKVKVQSIGVFTITLRRFTRFMNGSTKWSHRGRRVSVLEAGSGHRIEHGPNQLASVGKR